MGDIEQSWTLQIKYGSQQLEVSLPASANIQELQERLQELTGAFVRKQKLIHKGKVLASSHDLAKAGLKNGAKLMLLLSDASVVTTQGQQALQQQKKARQEEAAQRVRDLFAEAKGLGGKAAAAAITAAAAVAPGTQKIDWQERKRNWEKTGIISLRDLDLTTLPDGLFDSGLQTARVADLSHNRLQCLPASLSRLTGLHTLRLEHNQLTTEGLPWEALAQLTLLTALSLDRNRLECVSEAGIGGLHGLQVLSLSHNSLSALPEALGQLAALRVLTVDGNRMELLPESIGGCSSLLELSAEGNRIRHLPPTLAYLTRLQTVRLDGNMITSVPPAILRDCASLAMLSLQENPITADQLRSTPGFSEYDARRVARCNKQLDGGVLAHASRTFTEGAEDRQWSRWGDAGGGGAGGAPGGGRT